jgi:hypothetical protein
MDDRLIGKTLRIEGATERLSKLVTTPAFLENLSSTGTVIATVRVSRPHYVPQTMSLRTRISPTIFTATMSKQGLQAAIDDSAVESIQPSQVVLGEDSE